MRAEKVLPFALAASIIVIERAPSIADHLSIETLSGAFAALMLVLAQAVGAGLDWLRARRGTG